ncbi:2-dehydro-3-deoxygalactonokinase [Luteimonas suaedae]|uniref:2-dehydro-3-deoxygalactonokinase n=1 Tax=Luteimonas suaedae TaxID=2605430 RepID=UPI0011EF4BC6|nr:2-dehydro-3-deoxygalactonokinase [Luteimonas suaedae]
MNGHGAGSGQRLVIDGGTTTTRVWAVDGDLVLARGSAMIGARDSARDGNNGRLVGAVRDLLIAASAEADARASRWDPRYVVAAGMITSPLGLVEVPHVEAPAGVDELARNVRTLSLPEASPLPILLVPGVRCGPLQPGLSDLAEVDVMRGEEVVCLGLVRTGQLPRPGLALSVGSHWKRVEVDADGRIASCTTTLSGELLHALRTQTVLAASVDAALPPRLEAGDLDAFRAGMRERARSGLPRAAFCTRLLERVAGSSARSRLLFLLGVVVDETLAHWRDAVVGRTIALLGAPVLCAAWHEALADAGSQGVVIDAADAESAFIAGATAIAQRAFAATA